MLVYDVFYPTLVTLILSLGVLSLLISRPLYLKYRTFVLKCTVYQLWLFLFLTANAQGPTLVNCFFPSWLPISALECEHTLLSTAYKICPTALAAGFDRTASSNGKSSRSGWRKFLQKLFYTSHYQTSFLLACPRPHMDFFRYYYICVTCLHNLEICFLIVGCPVGYRFCIVLTCAFDFFKKGEI